MKITGINHIGLAPKDPQKAKDFLQNVLGLPFSGSELVLEQKTETFFYNSLTNGIKEPSSLSRLEILENQEGQNGPIKSFIEKKGGGIHHIALSVDNVDEAFKELTAKNITLLSDSPRNGAHNTKVVFIHPKEAGGLLIELVEG